MKEKIELQLVQIQTQMTDAYKSYLALVADLNDQQDKLQQALLYATDVSPDVQKILDDAAK